MSECDQPTLTETGEPPEPDQPTLTETGEPPEPQGRRRFQLTRTKPSRTFTIPTLGFLFGVPLQNPKSKIDLKLMPHVIKTDALFLTGYESKKVEKRERERERKREVILTEHWRPRLVVWLENEAQAEKRKSRKWKRGQKLRARRFVSWFLFRGFKSRFPCGFEPLVKSDYLQPWKLDGKSQGWHRVDENDGNDGMVCCSRKKKTLLWDWTLSRIFRQVLPSESLSDDSTFLVCLLVAPPQTFASKSIPFLPSLIIVWKLVWK